MATDHRGNPLHAGKRTSDEERIRAKLPPPENKMFTMPGPGIALKYTEPVNPNDIVLTGNEAWTGAYYNQVVNDPETGRPHPEPLAWDFDTDSPKQKSKGVPKPKKAPTEEEIAKRDMFW